MDTSEDKSVEVVNLDLGERSYGIHIGAGLLGDKSLLASCISGRQVFIVTNETVAPLYLDRLLDSLPGFQVDSMTLPDGEQHKNLASLDRVITELLRHKHNRGTTIIALGGGVVGDTAGFAAATYQRGVGLIQIPTTLLSQVDSSVGGKTAVNHELGKNMIGAFHQPRAVIIDTDTLTTLPRRELSAGLAEVIKHGILADEKYFAWLEAEMDKLLALDRGSLTFAVKGSCEIKAAVVASDEREAGQRALLNLGHTFGHAIENGLGYGHWLHGEAVGAGLVMASELARRLDRCSPDDCRRVRELVRRAGLPVAPPAEIAADQLIELMAVDKKATDQGIRFVVPRGIGRADVLEGIEASDIRSVIEATREQAGCL
ncbi:MAG: 3-dehydroquinate synthase [Pseudomonadales bacterium]|nr:3-dehydroquinate synthase [Pseudomonadales bacterium]